MRTLLALLVVALAPPGALAQHNARYTPTGAETLTDVSGTSVDGPMRTFRSVRLDRFGADFLYGLSLWDGPNGPCSVTAVGWAARQGFPDGLESSWRHEKRFETYSERLGPSSRTTIDCTGGKSERSAEAAFPSPPRTTRPGTGPAIVFRGHNGAAAISGLRVCTDGSGAVRGMSLFTSTINAGGNGRVERSGTETAEFPGCDSWARARHCPKGQVATGVDLHYAETDAPGDRLTGMALRCRGVEVSPLG